MRGRRDPELTVRTNRRAYLVSRQVVFYIVRQLTGVTLEEIAREFCGRHHSTVLHCVVIAWASARAIRCGITGASL